MSDPELGPVTTQDGARSLQRVYVASPGAPAVVIFPAMGVEARFYDRFAAALQGAGLNVVIAELRGLGSSSVRAGRGADFGYWTLLTQDWPAHLAAAQARFPGSPLHLMGHSLGGQIGALYLGVPAIPVESFTVIAAGSIHWRGWPGARGLYVLGFTQLARVIAETLGYFPGNRLGFGGREARTVIRDWSRASKSGVFQPVGAPEALESRLLGLTPRVLGISIEGDNWAPRGALDRLLEKLPGAQLQRLHYQPPEPLPGHPHFGWAKTPGTLIETVATFLRGGSAAE